MISLRRQVPTDLPGLVALSVRAWADVEKSVDAVLGSPLDRLVTPDWSTHHETVVTDACNSPETSVVVAEDDSGEVVGFAACMVHRNSSGRPASGEITLIAVDPASRGLGIGAQLLDHAVEALKNQGAPVIMVETGGDEGHAPARALYESAGFRLLPIAQYWLSGRQIGTPGDP